METKNQKTNNNKNRESVQRKMAAICDSQVENVGEKWVVEGIQEAVQSNRMWRVSIDSR